MYNYSTNNAAHHSQFPNIDRKFAIFPYTPTTFFKIRVYISMCKGFTGLALLIVCPTSINGSSFMEGFWIISMRLHQWKVNSGSSIPFGNINILY